jgi:hypothetical protein
MIQYSKNVLKYFVDQCRGKLLPFHGLSRKRGAESFFESGVGGGFANRSCSEVFVFGAFPTEMIPREAGRPAAIQIAVGDSAYSVVDDAS